LTTITHQGIPSHYDLQFFPDLSNGNGSRHFISGRREVGEDPTIAIKAGIQVANPIVSRQRELMAIAD
jgi:hypothetical protein